MSTFSEQMELSNPGEIIIVTYGGWGEHCGEVFSGKALTKVDRFVVYIFMEITKSVVKIRLRKCCLVQLSYAIGVLKPDDLDAGVVDQGITFWYAS